MPEGTCQALEAHQKGVHGVGQLHTPMNQVGQSQTAPLRLRIPVILTMTGPLQILHAW